MIQSRPVNAATARARGGVGWRIAVTSVWLIGACDGDPTFGDGQIDVRWTISEGSGIAAPPYVDAELTLFAPLVSPGLVAASTATGTLLWHADIDISAAGRSRLPLSRPARVGNLVVVPAWDLVALDAADGSVRWRYAPNFDFPGVTSPAVAGSRIVSSGNYLHVVDATTGQVVWWQNLEERPFEPVVDDGVIYFGARGPIPGSGEYPEAPLGAGHVWAIDLETGGVLWKTFLPADPSDPARGGVSGLGALTEDLFIVAGADLRIHALSRATGDVVWSTPTPGPTFRAGVVVVDGVAVTAGLQGGASGYDVVTGEPLWTFPVSSSITSPLVLQGSNVVMTVGRLFAIEAVTGRQVWADGGAAWGGPIYLSAAAVAPDGTVIAGDEKAVYALDTR